MIRLEYIRVRRFLRVAMVSCISLVLTQCATAPKPAEWGVWTPDEHSELFTTKAISACVSEADEAEFMAEIHQWVGKLPFYLRAHGARELMSLLAASESIKPLRDKPLRLAELGLTTKNQRALWALEQLTGCRMPQDAAAEDPNGKEWQQRAKQITAGYFNGVFDASVNMDRLRPSPIKLGSWRGKVQIGISDEALQYGQAMADLLDQWQPIGRRYEELVSIIGVEGIKWETTRLDGTEAEMIEYAMDTGWMGSQWYFVLKNGRIAEVRQ